MNTYVIILNWKGWQDTIKCIDSLKMLAQRPHIVVVDNASGDESTVRIRTAHPDVHLIESSQNLGFAGGNNLGIRYALEHGAKYVWLLNNDTVVHIHALTALLQEAEHSKNRALVGSRLHFYDCPAQLQAWGGGTVNLKTGRSRHICAPMASMNYLIGASLLIPRNILETIGFLDEGFFLYWEDTDYAFRAQEAGFHLTVAMDSLVLHKESASLGKRSALLDYYFSRSSIRFFLKHSPQPWRPILTGMLTRTAARVLQRDWVRAWAVWKPLVELWRRT